MSSFQGFSNRIFNPNPSSDFAKDAFGNFDLAYNGLSSLYSGPFGGTSFGDFLGSGGGKRRAEQAFNEKNASILGGGGTLYDLLDPISFLKTWNPLETYMNMNPRDRGENPAAFSPFLTFRRH